jgi:hypothetical protein
VFANRLAFGVPRKDVFVNCRSFRFSMRDRKMFGPDLQAFPRLDIQTS